jgi:hypothetical protein
VKGKDDQNWNWQKNGERPEDELQEERDYLSNVEFLSHCQQSNSAENQLSGDKEEEEGRHQWNSNTKTSSDMGEEEEQVNSAIKKQPSQKRRSSPQKK